MKKKTNPPKAKRRRTDSFVETNLDVVANELKNWPHDKPINWSELARLCHIDDSNAGQKVRELITECNIDLSPYIIPEYAQHVRRQKVKLPGNEISVPSLPTIKSLQGSIKHLIDTGVLNLGELCSPYAVGKTSVGSDGTVVTVSSDVRGRKITLLDIRKSLLKKHEPFMRLKTDQELEELSMAEVEATL